MTGGRILIVDDDRSFVEAAAIYLEDHGFQVCKTYCGRDAIVESMRRPADLVIVDLHLPDMNGIEVADQIRCCQPSARVVFISSDDSPEIAGRCRAAKGQVFLPKPLVPQTLIETIARVLAPLPSQKSLAAG